VRGRGLGGGWLLCLPACRFMIVDQLKSSPLFTTTGITRRWNGFTDRKEV